MSLTANERAELCDLFQQVGPDAPTLCEGWNTRDLLAHMLVRERRPDAAIAIVVPFFREHATLRSVIARVIPGYEQLAAIDRTREEFQVDGRTFHEPRFGTPDGRARMRPTPVPAYAPGPDEFRLMTLRSEGQFNTVVYEEEDVYRGNERRDVVMMSAEDAERLGLGKDSRVRVENAVGSMSALVRIAPLPPGNLAMYYPEANILVPRQIDPRSATPAFKSTTARIVAL